MVPFSEFGSRSSNRCVINMDAIKKLFCILQLRTFKHLVDRCFQYLSDEGKHVFSIIRTSTHKVLHQNLLWLWPWEGTHECSQSQQHIQFIFVLNVCLLKTALAAWLLAKAWNNRKNHVLTWKRWSQCCCEVPVVRGDKYQRGNRHWHNTGVSPSSGRSSDHLLCLLLQPSCRNSTFIL